MIAAEAVVRTAGEGEHRSFCGGGLMTFKATSEQTAARDQFLAEARSPSRVSG